MQKKTRIRRRGESRKDPDLLAAQTSPSTNNRPSTGSGGCWRRRGRSERNDNFRGDSGSRAMRCSSVRVMRNTVPHVDVQITHELLDALARRAVTAITQVQRHRRLHVLAHHIHRPVGEVMQLRPHPQQKIVGRFQLLALGGADELPLLQVRQRARAVFEKSHPQGGFRKSRRPPQPFLMFGSCMHAELPCLVRRSQVWSARRAAIYLSSKPTTHLLTTVFWNFANSARITRDRPLIRSAKFLTACRYSPPSRNHSGRAPSIRSSGRCPT